MLAQRLPPIDPLHTGLDVITALLSNLKKQATLIPPVIRRKYLVLRGFRHTAYLPLFCTFWLHSWRLDARQIKAKGRALIGNALLQPELAAHRLDVAATDIEPQTSAPHRRCQRARRPHELLEDALLILRQNSLALVR